MKVTFTAEEHAFREEVRDFFRDKFPARLREQQLNGIPLEKEGYIQ